MEAISWISESLKAGSWPTGVCPFSEAKKDAKRLSRLADSSEVVGAVSDAIAAFARLVGIDW